MFKLKKINKIAYLTVALFMVFFSEGCKSDAEDTPPPAANGEISFSKDVQPIFDISCTPCHNPGAVDLRSTAAPTSLINQPSLYTGTGRILVVPSDSLNSVLYQRVFDVNLPAGVSKMPKNAVLSEASKAIIKSWIDQGAKNN